MSLVLMLVLGYMTLCVFALSKENARLTRRLEDYEETATEESQ